MGACQTRKSLAMLRERWYESAATKQYTYRGEPVSDRDSRLLQSMIVFAGCTCIDLLSATNSSGGQPGYDAWLNSFEELDAYEFGSLTKKVDEALKALCNDPTRSWVGSMSYRRFKRDVGYPSKHWRYISCVKGELEKFFADGDPHAFAVCNTWINFTRRINLESVDLVSACEAEYVEFENVLHGQLEYDEDLISELRDQITTWFTGFHLSEGFKPHHGPGSVSGYTGKLSAGDKYLIMQGDASLRYLSKYLDHSVDDYCPIPMGDELKRVSELVCVPKSMISNRTISREPVALQYFQQGVRQAVLDFIDEHPVIRRHVRLNDQEASQELCALGSYFGEFATVDLSSASDSVTKTLVYRVFSGVKELQFALCCTRSHYTKLSDGRVVHMEKFAPMGSATCFITMSLLLAACCEIALKHTRSRLKEEGEDCKVLSKKYLVYGDDIIVDSLAWDELKSILDRLHFKVNTSKSYYVPALCCNFREACGAEYMDGVDVAPMRIPRFFKGAAGYRSDAGVAMASYVQFANNAYRKGMMCLRQAILDEMWKTWPESRYLLFDTDGSVGIQTSPEYCTNFHLKTRYEGWDNPKLVRQPNYGYVQYHGIVLSAVKDCDRCHKFGKQVDRCCHCPVDTLRKAVRKGVAPEDIKNLGVARWEQARLFERLLGVEVASDYDQHDYDLGLLDLRPHGYCRTTVKPSWQWVNDPGLRPRGLEKWTNLLSSD